MELIERTGFLNTLSAKFRSVKDGEGHCILLSGEAGIGKTSVVKEFCNEVREDCKIFQGSCDALFTPRPLAPLYDIAWQIRSDLFENSSEAADRAVLFTRIFYELGSQKGPTLVVFEDIHWADEATLDFIKFLARRITRIHCLFILTYRDDDVHFQHPLRNVIGHLAPDSFTRIQLTPLSRPAVEKMAAEKGYNGENVYTISGGNPFYVNEILASYSPGVPDNIKDSVLSVYNRQQGNTKSIWEILSVIPTGLEIKYLEKIAPAYLNALEICLGANILNLKQDHIFFKHELYRRTIESALSPLVRVELNKKVLDLFLEKSDQILPIERIIHHAKNANEHDIVVQYAPVAAGRAAALGAHIEASRLYLTAIEFYEGKDRDILIRFYESYAYECYLTIGMKEAIIYQTRALNLQKEKQDIENIGNSLRFLSRLWWCEGNRKKAEFYGNQSIEVLTDQPSSRAKALAFSNMSQLKMLSDEFDDCIFWGEQAIAIAKELTDEETLSHALNNVGSVKAMVPALRGEGFALIKQSLEISLKNSFHEHVARAYTNLEHIGFKVKDFEFAREMLEAGIQYSEERDLNSWTEYMLADKAKMFLQQGHWDEAFSIATELNKNDDQAQILRFTAFMVVTIINMRKGDRNIVPRLTEARERAFEAGELTRIIPALSALLEYEWITGTRQVSDEALKTTLDMITRMGNIYDNSEFAFWLFKSRKQHVPFQEFYPGYQADTRASAMKAAALWEKLGCPYEQALTLFEGTETDKRKAINIVHRLGATVVFERMKMEMRNSGIKRIPRGIRASTRSNAALLTERELDVLKLLQEGMQNKEIASALFISAKTVDHHITSIFFKLDVNSRVKAVQKAGQLKILK
jgi:DNA-binding CsgD family transcriptional regulator